MRKARIYIGTSGWMYKDWHKKFYPKTLKKDFLKYYAEHFKTVEVNNSFYHTPPRSIFEKWKREVPPNFAFAVKINRSITHTHRLKNCSRELKYFLSSAKGLGKKLSVILIQLPPSLKYDEERLVSFLELLQAASHDLRLKTRFALEPRHKTWFQGKKKEILKVLKKYKVAAVLAHSSRYPFYDLDDSNITAKFVYLRLHGPRIFASSKYGERRLIYWTKAIKKWKRRGLDIYAYFNNDVHAYAIDDVTELKRLVGGDASSKN